jgi:hypothetical protein
MMDIRVDPVGFVWSDETTRLLWAPEGCADGIVRVIRRGLIYDTAYVCRPGPELLCCFYGLQKLWGVAYDPCMRAYLFALGDRVEIDIPDGMTEREYWNEMTKS